MIWGISKLNQSEIYRVLSQSRLFSNWNMGYMNNSHEIQEMIRKVTGRESAPFETLSYPHAKLILLQLSFLL